MNVKIGDVVRWNWNDGTVTGRIESIDNYKWVNYSILNVTGVYTEEHNVGEIKGHYINENTVKLKGYDTPLYKALNGE